MQHQCQTGLSATELCGAATRRGAARCAVCTESHYIRLQWRPPRSRWSLAGQRETSGLQRDLCDISRPAARPPPPPEGRAGAGVQQEGHKHSLKATHDYICIIRTILKHKQDTTRRSRHRPPTCITSPVKVQIVSTDKLGGGGGTSLMRCDRLGISIRKSVLHINPSFN